ncbi:MAG: DUF748 domain-containing protein [Candidatus Methylomirabilales bacterium]
MSTLAVPQVEITEQVSHRPRHYPAGPGLVFLFVVLPLLLLPEVVRHVAVQHLDALIPAPVAIRDVDLNLFTGRAQVSDLVIGGDGNEAILLVPTLDLQFSRRALLRRQMVLHTVTARQPMLRLERTGTRRWNVTEIFRSLVAGDADTGEFTMGRLDVQGGRVSVVDHTTTPAATSLLTDFALTIRPVPVTPEAKPGQVTGHFRADGAPVEMSGTLHFHPFVSHLKVTPTQVPLTFFQGYVQHFLPGAEAVSGELDGRLNVVAAFDQQENLVIEMSGAVKGRSVALRFSGDQEPFFHAARLTADPLRTSNMPIPHAEIANVQLRKATVRIERDPEGKFNLRRLWAALPPKGKAGQKPPGPADALSPIAIRHLEARESRILFVDGTVTPTFTGALSDTTVEVRKPSPQTDRASLNIKGAMGGSAPVELKGWFTVARPLKVHLQGTIHDYELSRVNPYAVKYVRHQVQRGRVTTEVKYRYDAGNLAAGNEIRIRQIKVGDPIGKEFEGQVGIPLKLALALLEGLDGEITLEVPVHGKLDNPEFRFSSVVWKAVGNAILKALTAPFRLIGKIVTVGGKITEVRIDPIGFQPGSLKPDPKGAKRINRLVKFLRKRPNVELQLRGRASRQEVKALARKRRRGRASTEQQLRKLAEDRARSIERALVRRGVPAKQLFVLTGDPRAVKKRGAGQVEFRLLK